MSSRWKIYYADGTIADSEDTTAEYAPVEGVAAVAHWKDGKKLLHSLGEVYGWDGTDWEAAPEVRKRWPSSMVVKFGKQMTKKKFQATRLKAIEWLHKLG